LAYQTLASAGFNGALFPKCYGYGKLNPALFPRGVFTREQSERLGTGSTVEAVYQIILLEYLHSSNLAQFTHYDKHKPLSICFYEEALALRPRFEDLLARLHSLCITHNSVKACNLFVESDGHELEPRLLDLGRVEISVPAKY